MTVSRNSIVAITLARGSRRWMQVSGRRDGRAVRYRNMSHQRSSGLSSLERFDPQADEQDHSQDDCRTDDAGGGGSSIDPRPGRGRFLLFLIHSLPAESIIGKKGCFFLEASEDGGNSLFLFRQFALPVTFSMDHSRPSGWVEASQERVPPVMAADAAKVAMTSSAKPPGKGRDTAILSRISGLTLAHNRSPPP